MNNLIAACYHLLITTPTYSPSWFRTGQHSVRIWFGNWDHHTTSGLRTWQKSIWVRAWLIVVVVASAPNLVTIILCWYYNKCLLTIANAIIVNRSLLRPRCLPARLILHPKYIQIAESINYSITFDYRHRLFLTLATCYNNNNNIYTSWWEQAS